MNRLLPVVSAVLLSGCFAFVTKEEGREIKQQIEDVKGLSSQNEVKAAELAKQMDVQLKRLKQVVDEATKVVTRNSADVGQTVEKLQTDLGQLQGRVEEMQHSQDALMKQFQDFRANSDTKLEQLTNAANASKAPPIPETPDAVFADAEKKLAAQQWLEARRLFDAFVNRYPTDARAGKAQFNIGEAYAGEKRLQNAIVAYEKVVTSFPKSDVAPEAMYKNGLLYFQLKYCTDARTYFMELLRRYPKTTFKKEANEQLKNLQRDAKNKNICLS